MMRSLVKVSAMTHPHKTLPMWQVLACGAAIVTLSMGVRHGFGLWLQPITQAQDWTRENFAMAIAIQNLTWGFAGIFSGMLADRFGAFRVIVTCAVFYALGLLGMAYSSTPALFTATAGVLIGIAHDACAIYEFWRAAEMIELGRQAAARALDQFEAGN